MDDVRFFHYMTKYERQKGWWDKHFTPRQIILYVESQKKIVQANPGIKKYKLPTCPIHDTSWNYPLDALESNENKKSKIQYLWYKRTIAMEQIIIELPRDVLWLLLHCWINNCKKSYII